MQGCLWVCHFFKKKICRTKFVGVLFFKSAFLSFEGKTIIPRSPHGLEVCTGYPHFSTATTRTRICCTCGTFFGNCLST